MSQNDITFVALIILVVILLGHAFGRYWDSISAEAELTAEWNLLERHDAGDCGKEKGCDTASFQLTLQTKKSEVFQAFAAANRNKRKAGGAAALTVLGFILILYLYPQLRSGMRFGSGTQSQSRRETA